jgi:hypothetical protein
MFDEEAYEMAEAIRMSQISTHQVEDESEMDDEESLVMAEAIRMSLMPTHQVEDESEMDDGESLVMAEAIRLSLMSAHQVEDEYEMDEEVYDMTENEENALAEFDKIEARQEEIQDDFRDFSAEDAALPARPVVYRDFVFEVDPYKPLPAAPRKSALYYQVQAQMAAKNHSFI